MPQLVSPCAGTLSGSPAEAASLPSLAARRLASRHKSHKASTDGAPPTAGNQRTRLGSTSGCERAGAACTRRGSGRRASSAGGNCPRAARTRAPHPPEHGASAAPSTASWPRSSSHRQSSRRGTRFAAPRALRRRAMRRPKTGQSRAGQRRPGCTRRRQRPWSRRQQERPTRAARNGVRCALLRPRLRTRSPWGATPTRTPRAEPPRTQGLAETAPPPPTTR